MARKAKFERTPKVKNGTVEVRCLGLACGVTFLSESKFLRFCPKCDGKRKVESQLIPEIRLGQEVRFEFRDK